MEALEQIKAYANLTENAWLLNKITKVENEINKIRSEAFTE